MNSGTIRIMVVEDEYIISEDIKRNLKSSGFEVVAVASSGREAIELAAENKPSLILMDIMLRGEMDGIQAARVIYERLSIPIIFLTSLTGHQTLERALATEPFAYLLKPVTELELKAAIEMALYKHNLYRKLKESEHWLFCTLNSIGVGVVTTDPVGYVTFINLAGLVLAGLTVEEAVGTSLLELFSFVNQLTGASQEHPIASVIREKKPFNQQNLNLIVNTKGRTIPVNGITSPIIGSKGELLGVVMSFQDQTECYRLEQELRLMTLTDDLTGLNNRRGFMLLSEQQLKVARRLGSEVAIVFIDMDGMKWINDTFGHLEGDKALINTAHILRETFRDSDIIARIGGDEFVVMVTDVNILSSDELAGRLYLTTTRHNERLLKPYNISLSVGIVRYDPLNHESIDDIIDRADRLMYQQKLKKR